MKKAFQNSHNIFVCIDTKPWNSLSCTHIAAPAMSPLGAQRCSMSAMGCGVYLRLGMRTFRRRLRKSFTFCSLKRPRPSHSPVGHPPCGSRRFRPVFSSSGALFLISRYGGQYLFQDWSAAISGHTLINSVSFPPAWTWSGERRFPESSKRLTLNLCHAYLKAVCGPAGSRLDFGG